MLLLSSHQWQFQTPWKWEGSTTGHLSSVDPEHLAMSSILEGTAPSPWGSAGRAGGEAVPATSRLPGGLASVPCVLSLSLAVFED